MTPDAMSFDQALSQRRSVRAFTDAPVSLASLKRLLRAAQGKTGDDGKRTAPSAHALYPLRLFVMAANVDGLGTGLHAVNPDTGEIGQIHDRDVRTELQRAAVDDQSWIGEAACIVCLCADFVTPCRDFADQPPLGRRGARYVYIEAGAAAQNALLQATVDGIGGVLVAGFHDERTSDVLGLETPLAPVLHLCFGQRA